MDLMRTIVHDVEELKYDGSLCAIVPLSFIVRNYYPVYAADGLNDRPAYRDPHITADQAWDEWFKSESNLKSGKIKTLKKSIEQHGGVNTQPIIVSGAETSITYPNEEDQEYYRYSNDSVIRDKNGNIVAYDSEFSPSYNDDVKTPIIAHYPPTICDGMHRMAALQQLGVNSVLVRFGYLKKHSNEVGQED